jgi:hypothetical protein
MQAFPLFSVFRIPGCRNAEMSWRSFFQGFVIRGIMMQASRSFIFRIPSPRNAEISPSERSTAQALLEPTTTIQLDRRSKSFGPFPETSTARHVSSLMDGLGPFGDFYETPTIFHVSSLMDGPGPFANSPFAILETLHSRSPGVRIPEMWVS